MAKTPSLKASTRDVCMPAEPIGSGGPRPSDGFELKGCKTAPKGVRMAFLEQRSDLTGHRGARTRPGESAGARRERQLELRHARAASSRAAREPPANTRDR